MPLSSNTVAGDAARRRLEYTVKDDRQSNSAFAFADYGPTMKPCVPSSSSPPAASILSREKPIWTDKARVCGVCDLSLRTVGNSHLESCHCDGQRPPTCEKQLLKAIKFDILVSRSYSRSGSSTMVTRGSVWRTRKRYHW